MVKLLGALEIEGTKRPVTAGPLLEIIVFLALNPGRTFTSVQLRESIWGLGRQPITSDTFRKYMVALRKAFGPGVVVTDRLPLRDDRMRSPPTGTSSELRLEADDELAGREQGLALVRGPVLHGSFDGRKNSPFAWAIGNANAIEDEVTSVAVRPRSGLPGPGRSPPGRHGGLPGPVVLGGQPPTAHRRPPGRCRPGGPKEVGRRLEAARAAMATFPKDVTELEEEARTLGWVSVVPGEVGSGRVGSPSPSRCRATGVN